MNDTIRKLLLILVGAMLGGCAETYSEPVLDSNHPASPAAEVGAVPEPSPTLALTDTDPRTQPAEVEHRHGDAAPVPTQSPQPAGHDHEEDTPGAPATPAARYVCPMHPEVTADKPDQRCPECGMKLRESEGAKEP